jgi:hypothetical protein
MRAINGLPSIFPMLAAEEFLLQRLFNTAVSLKSYGRVRMMIGERKLVLIGIALLGVWVLSALILALIALIGVILFMLGNYELVAMCVLALISSTILIVLMGGTLRQTRLWPILRWWFKLHVVFLDPPDLPITPDADMDPHLFFDSDVEMSIYDLGNKDDQH